MCTNRIAIYALYAPGGKLREHVVCYVRGLLEVAAEVWVVVNGGLDSAGKVTLAQLGVHVLERENSGYDFAAWRNALASMDAGQLAAVDELLLCNCSCYGPIYPFSEVFEHMACREGDMWGMFRHAVLEGYFPSHLQSYFLVFRKSILKSAAWAEYWRQLVPAADWNAAVQQEVHFTEYFEQRGFKTASYVEADKYDHLLPNPTVQLPVPLLRYDRFPLLKRKAFTETEVDFRTIGNASQAREALDEVRDAGFFPVCAIYEDLLASLPASRLKQVLQLIFTVPGGASRRAGTVDFAIAVFSERAEYVAELAWYLRMLPKGIEIWVVTGSAEVYQEWQNAGVPALQIRLVDEEQMKAGASGLLCRELAEKHDWLCVLRDAHVSVKEHPAVCYSLLHQCWQCMLGTGPGYAEYVGELLQQKPVIGLILPCVPQFASKYLEAIKKEWEHKKALAREVLKTECVHVPFDETPDLCYGGMFWVRSEVLRKFLYENDACAVALLRQGKCMSLFEYMLPMLAQASGYTTCQLMPERVNAAVHHMSQWHEIRMSDVLQGCGEKTVRTPMVLGVVKSWLRRKFRKKAKRR